MPRLVSQLTEEQWSTEGPQTPAQDFWLSYGTIIDQKTYPKGMGKQYHARDVVFHNTNNAEYHGADEMEIW